ncbi:hypothetical protein NHG24_07915 [Aerococcaceae bacterium NML210727]|nr:hypothetical protein [Aerococcaceae bacterium NML210727]MCW6655057.1 hypothetical protein [Aerococcaceae bacterium NML201296]
MKIKDLVALDYAMFVIAEIYEIVFKKELKYDLIFQQNSDIFTGKLVRFNPGGPEISTLDNNLKNMVRTFTVDDTDHHDEKAFSQIRHQLFRHFDVKRETRMNEELMSNSHLLLEFLIDFTKNYEIEAQYIPNSFQKYFSLSTNVELPFKLINDNEYDVVSLRLQS